MSDGAEFKNRKMASGRQFITIYDRADLSYTGRKGRQRKPLYVAGAVIPDPLKRADIRRDLLGVGFSFASLKAPPSETNNTTAEFRLDVLRGVLKKNGRSDLCPEEYLSWARNFYRPNVPAKFPIPYDHRLAEKFATLTDPVKYPPKMALWFPAEFKESLTNILNQPQTNTTFEAKLKEDFLTILSGADTDTTVESPSWTVDPVTEVVFCPEPSSPPPGVGPESLAWLEGERQRLARDRAEFEREKREFRREQQIFLKSFNIEVQAGEPSEVNGEGD